MKTTIKMALLAIVAIAFCACEEEPTFRAFEFDESQFKAEDITASSVKLTGGIDLICDGDYGKKGYVYFLVTDNPSLSISGKKGTNYWYTTVSGTSSYTKPQAGTYAETVTGLPDGTTLYWALCVGDIDSWTSRPEIRASAHSEIRSFTTVGLRASKTVVDLGLSVK